MAAVPFEGTVMDCPETEIAERFHGLEPVTLCYYDWESVKRFWQDR